MDQYKSKDDKFLEKKYEERYNTKVEKLIDLIKESSIIFKRDTTVCVEGVTWHIVKWTVDDYTIESEFRKVCSIEADDVERPIFVLKRRDYNKIAKACNQRKNELLQQHRQRKK